MIDTDKYEGHTEGPWKLHYDGSAIDDDYLDYGAQLDPVGALYPMSVVDAQLMADAPLLLAEVMRLREELRIERRIVQAFYDYRDARCYEDCEAWMLEKGHRVMVKYGNEEQSEWNEAVLLNWWKKND